MPKAKPAKQTSNDKHVLTLIAGAISVCAANQSKHNTVRRAQDALQSAVKNKVGPEVFKIVCVCHDASMYEHLTAVAGDKWKKDNSADALPTLWTEQKSRAKTALESGLNPNDFDNLSAFYGGVRKAKAAATLAVKKAAAQHEVEKAVEAGTIPVQLATFRNELTIIHGAVETHGKTYEAEILEVLNTAILALDTAELKKAKRRNQAAARRAEAKAKADAQKVAPVTADTIPNGSDKGAEQRAATA